MSELLSKMPDAILIAQVRDGQSELFAELVRRYQPALTRVARSRLGRADWADDVVQETFLAAFKSCASYDPQYSFRTWLWTILLNKCRGHYQRRTRDVACEPWSAECEQSAPVESDPAASPLARLLLQERNARLEALLGELTTVQADALRLRFFAGLKFPEIAETMQCSLNTAKMRVRSGLLKMGELLAARAGLPSDESSQEL